MSAFGSSPPKLRSSRAASKSAVTSSKRLLDDAVDLWSVAVVAADVMLRDP